MQTQRFASRADAERHLVQQGFHFQGAPSRWRKVTDGTVHYADVVMHNGGAVVMFTQAAEGIAGGTARADGAAVPPGADPTD